MNFKIFLIEAFLFTLTLILGMGAAFNWQGLLSSQNIQLQSVSIWQIILYFSISTLVIFSISLLGIKFQRPKRTIFKILFIFSSVLGLFYFFFPFLYDSSLILVVALIYVWLKKPTVFLNNFLIIFGLAGFGGVIGLSLQPLVIVFLLLLFSIYDFIAVYKTKHMVKMAREMIASKIIFGLIIPQKISDFRADLKEVEPGGRFLILGGGDIAFPLLLSSSLVPSGILNSFIVAAFSLIGLFLSFYIFISQKVRQPIPALPPIALFSIIGFLFIQFFFKNIF